MEGFRFYESQQPGLGFYFLDNFYGDIESLHLYAGIHRRVGKRYHRLLSKRLPFAVFDTATSDGAWAYTTTTNLPAGQQVVIEVTATDRPGHKTTKKQPMG